MTAATVALRSERWLDEVVVFGQLNNVDGDTAMELAHPPGVGDLAIMEVLVDADQIATIVASVELQAVRAVIIDAAGTTVDIVGVERWSQRELTNIAVSTFFSPDPLVLWRENERFQIKFREVDTNASPTADIGVYVKAARIPLAEPTARGPIRLVR